MKELEKEGFWKKEKIIRLKLDFRKSQVPIEFYMSEQWFMKMDELIKPAMDAVNKNKINFYPKHWSKHIIIGYQILKTGALVVSCTGGIKYLFGITKKINQDYMFQ